MSKRAFPATEQKSAQRPKLRRPAFKKKAVRKPVVRKEMKFVDSGVNYFGAGKSLLAASNYSDLSDATYRLNLISEGTDRDNRIGRKVVIKKIDLSAWIFNNPLLNDPAPGFHATVVIWMDKDGTAPASTALTNLFTVDTGGTLVNYNFLRNLEDSARYQVLARKEFDYIGPRSGTNDLDTYPSAREVSAHLIVDIPVTYPSVGTSPNDKLIFVSFVTNHVQGTTAGFINPSLYFKARVWFEDQ